MADATDIFKKITKLNEKPKDKPITGDEISATTTDVVNDTNDDSTKDITSDTTGDVSTDIDSDVNSDSTADINSDIASDTIGDTSSDINSYTNSDINNVIRKRDKYTDIHSRKTYYIEKNLIKKIDKLSTKNNLDKSFIINEALRRFFIEIESNK